MKPLVINLDVTGNLEMQKVHAYVDKHYSNWLNHSEWHCSKAGFPDEAVDVLNEVLLSLLQKDEEKLLKLLNTKAKYGKFSDKEPFTELDIYILTMIRLNVTSTTAPYHSRYKKKSPIDYEVDFSRLKIIDEEDESPDIAARTLKQMRLLRYVLRGIDVDDEDLQIFRNEDILFERSKNVRGRQKVKYFIDIVTEILFRQGFTKKRPQNLIPEQTEVVERFFKTHKVVIHRKSNTQLFN